MCQYTDGAKIQQKVLVRPVPVLRGEDIPSTDGLMRSSIQHITPKFPIGVQLGDLVTAIHVISTLIRAISEPCTEASAFVKFLHSFVHTFPFICHLPVRTQQWASRSCWHRYHFFSFLRREKGLSRSLSHPLAASVADDRIQHKQRAVKRAAE